MHVTRTLFLDALSRKMRPPPQKPEGEPPTLALRKAFRAAINPDQVRGYVAHPSPSQGVSGVASGPGFGKGEGMAGLPAHERFAWQW